MESQSNHESQHESHHESQHESHHESQHESHHESQHESQHESYNQPNQDEMTEILLSKIKNFKNVDTKIKPIKNNLGVFNAITVHIKLSDIGNGVFHSATLKTVSYRGRMIKIKCVFTDNENLISDMKINRDSIFQCFRDISPDTITDISLEPFKDEKDNEHLRIIATTIKGSSIVYVYKRLMEFVNVINEKYGKLVPNDVKHEDITNILETHMNSQIPMHTYTHMNSNIHYQIPIQTHINSNMNTQTPMPTPMLTPMQTPMQTPIPTPIQTHMQIQNTHAKELIRHKISKLEIEEEVLLKQLEHVRLLKQEQYSKLSQQVESFADKVKLQLQKK